MQSSGAVLQPLRDQGCLQTSGTTPSWAVPCVPEVFTAQFTQLFKLECKGFNNFHGKQDKAHSSDFDLTLGVNASETTYLRPKKKLVLEQQIGLKSYQSHCTTERLFFYKHDTR